MDTVYLIKCWPPQAPRICVQSKEPNLGEIQSLKSDKLEYQIHQFFGEESEIFD